MDGLSFLESLDTGRQWDEKIRYAKQSQDRVVFSPYSLSDAQNYMCKVVWWLNVS